MYVDQEAVCYYLTVGNEPYEMPAMPEGARDGILRGMYLYGGREGGRERPVKLLGSGAIMHDVSSAQTMLREYGVDAEVWAVTSYQQLHRDGLAAERWSRLHPGEPARIPFVRSCLGEDPEALVVAVSDYVKALATSIAPWVPGTLVSLGTDGFGRSEARADLRDYFEVDARHITWATLAALARRGRIAPATLEKARRKLAIDPGKPDPTAV
jgi:pyruvate dehydrogenase E1 component